MIDATGLAVVKLLQWVKYKLTGDDPRNWRLELHDNGFRCFARKRCDDVRWCNLRSIRTYYRAVYENNVVCISYETKSGERVEIDEKMKGFGLVIKQMERQFSNVPADWYDRMKFPSTKAAGRTLWQSGGDDAQDADP